MARMGRRRRTRSAPTRCRRQHQELARVQGLARSVEAAKAQIAVAVSSRLADRREHTRCPRRSTSGAASAMPRAASSCLPAVTTCRRGSQEPATAKLCDSALGEKAAVAGAVSRRRGCGRAGHAVRRPWRVRSVTRHAAALPTPALVARRFDATVLSRSRPPGRLANTCNVGCCALRWCAAHVLSLTFGGR
jgi:hypothetical protein